jgi:hypothetical protein
MQRRPSKPWLTLEACFCAFMLCGCGSSDVLARAHLVEVVSVAPREQPVVALTVTRPSVTRQIVGWIDRLRPVPRGVFNCPLFDAVEPTVTLTFRTRARGAALATVSETDYGFGSGACNPLTLAVPGHKTRALLGGRFLERLQRLLGVNFGFGSAVIEGGIYMAGGPEVSRRRSIAGHVTLYLARTLRQPHSRQLSSETIPRSGQHFYFEEGPGVYYLRASSLHGKPAGCPPTTVTVRAGETADVSVPWGCLVK